MTYGHESNDVDLVFVIARPKTLSLARLIAFETTTYNDILFIDGPENMDNGKTFWYFSAVSTHSKYDFVMKADTDVFINLDNLVIELKRLQKIYKKKIYFGRINYNPNWGYFHAGMGYVLSWDLVQFMVNDPWCREHNEWQEDTMVAKCLEQPNVLEYGMLEPLDPTQFHDEWLSGKEWKKHYKSDSILIHQLKRSDWFLRCALTYLPHKIPIHAIEILHEHRKWSQYDSISNP